MATIPSTRIGPRGAGRPDLVARGPFGIELLEARQLLAFDPTPAEQYMLELTNRMRADPAAELGLLTTSLGNPARSSDPDVDSALRYFKTKGSVLSQQWAELSPAPPLAWNENLYRASEAHSQVMIDQDVQTHQGAGEPDLGGQATAAGYTGWSSLGQSVYAFARSIIHGHAGFAIDWGGEPGDPATTGIQDPPGHRETMMNASFREVGIRVLVSPVASNRQTGPLVITQDFGRRFNQGNPYLLGVVFQDDSRNAFYDVGEGLGGVTVTAVGANGTPGAPTFTATTMSAGGWQMQVPPGTYQVTISGGRFGTQTYRSVSVGSQNVKLDAVKGVAPPVPNIQVSAKGAAITPGDQTPALADGTDLGNADYLYQFNDVEYTVRNTGNLVLNLGAFPRVVISGPNASEFTLRSPVPSTIAPGGEARFTIRFNPGDFGLRTANVTIASDDPDTPGYAFAIQGRGVRRPIMQASGNQAVIAAGDATPTTADWSKFAGIDALDATKVRIFTVRNVGQKLMNLATNPVTITGPDAESFVVFQQPGVAQLQPGEAAQFRVRFTPAGRVGFHNATVSIASDDPVTPAYTFAVQGNGLARPRAQVSGGGVPILAGDLDPSAADRTTFGVQAVEGGQLARMYTITNTGLADLMLTGTPRVTISGADAADFTVSLQPGLTLLGPGRSVTFKVRFDPTNVGTRAAVVNVFTNDLRAPTYSFGVSGVGV